MSKERELLKRWLIDFGKIHPDVELMKDTQTLLAQPEQELLDIPVLKAMLFGHIKHGDEEHQQWLHDAINDFYFGTAQPKPLSYAILDRQMESIRLEQRTDFWAGVEWAEQQHGIIGDRE